jgi:hypothetical protein
MHRVRTPPSRRGVARAISAVPRSLYRSGSGNLARVTCEMCESADRMEAGDHPFAIARLATGYVTLCASQYFRGYTFFAARSCVPEVYDLEPT